MLPKEQRLTTRDVALVFEGKRKTYANDFFRITVAPLSFLQKKYAVVIPKKTAQRAVDRNKIRRRVYNHIHRMNISRLPSCAVVVYCNKAVNTLSCDVFYNELEKILHKAGIK